MQTPQSELLPIEGSVGMKASEMATQEIHHSALRLLPDRATRLKQPRQHCRRGCLSRKVRLFHQRLTDEGAEILQRVHEYRCPCRADIDPAYVRF